MAVITDLIPQYRMLNVTLCLNQFPLFGAGLTVAVTADVVKGKK